MTGYRKYALAAILLLGCFALSSKAAAETTPGSAIVQLKVLTEAHKKHRYFHGALWLQSDKSQHNYRWGGLHCPGTELSDLQVSMLYSAFRSKYAVAIDFDVVAYKSATYRCLTGFTVSK